MNMKLIKPSLTDADRKLLFQIRGKLIVTLEVARLLEPGKTDRQILREQFFMGVYGGLVTIPEQMQEAYR